MKLYNDMIVKNNRVIAKSYAKINLTLDVLGKLENGYHEVCMIMQTVNLFDLVIVDKTSSGITLKTNIKSLPDNENNIAYKACKLFFEETKISGGAKILIHKNIPIAAGLAGGSGNAAAVLCALNALYDAKLSDDELCRLGLKLGADVPYCILGGTYLAEGIGEKLTKLADIPTLCILMVKPPINISTQMIYQKIDFSENLKHPDTKAMLSAIENKDISGITKNLENVMENVTIDSCPEVLEIKSKMLELGALGSVMSGSGPTVFGIFEDNISAKKACDFFSDKYADVFLVHTMN